MPRFQYLAKRSPTEVVEGVLEAENRAGVVNHLAGLGYTPIRIAETQEERGIEMKTTLRAPIARDIRVPHRHLNQFTRQFASLVRSQVSLFRALRILEEQTAHPKLRQIIQAVEEDIRQGQSLSEALAKYPKVFSALYVNLIRSGEIGGMLDTVLDRLAAQTEREEELNGKVQTALAYPLFVGVVGFFTVVFLFSFVIPRLIKLFDFFGSRLPLPTRILLGLATAFSKGWFWILGGLALLAVLGVWMSRRQRGRLSLAYLSLHLPLIGSLIRQLEIVRFARSFGLLLDRGVPILQATVVAIPVVKNRFLRQELERLPNHLKEGNLLSAGLKGLSFATPFLVNTVAVGEESGKAGEALLEVANFYEREVERLLHLMSALLEPVTILIVGGVVGFIVMAVLLPILTMSIIAH